MVLLFLSYSNDTIYGNSLGNTTKFERHSFAFKWKDEVAETILKELNGVLQELAYSIR